MDPLAWNLGLIANTTLLVVYFGIAFFVFRGTHGSGANPLALATGWLFLSCGIAHGVHALQVANLAGPISALDAAARTVYSEWHLVVIDLFTVGIGIWYLTLRRRLPHLVRGASLFEDLRTRRMRALDLNDNVVQGIAEAKLAVEMGRRDQAKAAVRSSRQGAEALVADMTADLERLRREREGRDSEREAVSPAGGEAA